MLNPRDKIKTGSRQRGFSTLELIISLGLGMVVIYAVTELMQYGLRAGKQIETKNEFQNIVQMVQSSVMFNAQNADCMALFPPNPTFPPGPAQPLNLAYLRLAGRTVLSATSWNSGLRAKTIELSKVGAAVEHKDSTGLTYAYQPALLKLAAERPGQGDLIAPASIPLTLYMGPIKDVSGNPTPGTARKILGCIKTQDTSMANQNSCTSLGGTYDAAANPPCKTPGLHNCQIQGAGLGFYKKWDGPLPAGGPPGGYVYDASCATAGQQMLVATGSWLGTYDPASPPAIHSSYRMGTGWHFELNYTPPIPAGQNLQFSYIAVCCDP